MGSPVWVNSIILITRYTWKHCIVSYPDGEWVWYPCKMTCKLWADATHNSTLLKDPDHYEYQLPSSKSVWKWLAFPHYCYEGIQIILTQVPPKAERL